MRPSAVIPMFHCVILLAFIGGIGPTELLIVGILAVILFGSRLPSVARSLGQSIVEFKKGMRDLEHDVRSSIYSEPTGRVSHDDKSPPATPKSDPPAD